MVGNFPAFLVLMSKSNIGLVFSVHGIKLVQVGKEIDLGDGRPGSPRLPGGPLRRRKLLLDVFRRKQNQVLGLHA